MLLNVSILIAIIISCFLIYLFLWKSNVKLRKNKESVYIAFNNKNQLFSIINLIMNNPGEEILAREILDSENNPKLNRYFTLEMNKEKSIIRINESTTPLLKALISLYKSKSKIESILGNEIKTSNIYSNLEEEMIDVSKVTIEIGESLKGGAPLFDKDIKEAIIEIAQDTEEILDDYFKRKVDSVSYEMKIYREIKSEKLERKNKFNNLKI